MITSLAPAIASAHNTPAQAIFTNPPAVTWSPDDGGGRMFDPYPFPTADASFDVAWTDGDTDPLSVHYLYYMDHAPSLGLTVDQVLQQATPIPEASGGIWAACSCPDDFGLKCPDAGARDCRNGFTWDTHALAPGAYWLVAVTYDDPYRVFSVSQGPVRVAHGGPLPPAVIVVEPDGVGNADQAFRLRWLYAGVDPIHVDLSYASSNALAAGAGYTSIANDVPMLAAGDATWAFDWDVSTFQSGLIYYVRARISDGTGATSFTDSRAGVSVFHPGDVIDFTMADPHDLSVSADAAAAPMAADSGCSLTRHAAPPLGMALLVMAIAVLGAGRRRA